MAAATEESQMSDVERASARVAELLAEREAANASQKPDPAAAVSPAEDKRLVERGKALHKKVGEVDQVEGQLRQVRASQSGKTLYLELGSLRGPNAICGRYRAELKVFTEKELRDLVGKRLRLRGKVVKDPSNRIAIDLGAKDAVEVIEG
jgi:hypothetical protein